VRVDPSAPTLLPREKEYSADARERQPLDRMAETLFDDAAAQTHFPVVEDGGLARVTAACFSSKMTRMVSSSMGWIRQGISSCR
jgi:hypothetical protein